MEVESVTIITETEGFSDLRGAVGVPAQILEESQPSRVSESPGERVKTQTASLQPRVSG